MELKTIRLDIIDPNPNQPRESLGDLTTLVDSIKKSGVLVPILVMESGTRYLTIAGHRRTGASRIAGLTEIPAIIASDWSEADRLLATMAENTVRLDMTAIEIAVGYQTLLNLGVDPDNIAKVTGGANAATVTAAAKVLPTIIGSEKYNQITIQQMAALNEFDGDKKSLKKLLTAIENGRNFDYELKNVRTEREHKAKVDAAKAALEAAGIHVITAPSWMPGQPKRLDSDPSYGTPEEHASCPGHCAFLDYAGDARYACDKPELHGDQSTVDAGIRKVEREQEEADRAVRKVEWENAAEVRLEFVKTQVSDRSISGPLFDWAVDRVEVADLTRGTDTRTNVFGELRTALARLVGLAVALMEFPAYNNRGLAQLYEAPGYVSTTLHNGSAAYTKYVDYLNTLIVIGYTVTPPEQTFLDNVAALIATEEAEAAAYEAARLTVDCALCSENAANGGDCTPNDDGHPPIYGIEVHDDGTVDSCFFAIDPDDGASAQTPDSDTGAEGAHEGEIGTPSTSVVNLEDAVAQAEASWNADETSDEVGGITVSSRDLSQLWKRALDEGTARLNTKGIGTENWDIHLTLTIAPLGTEASTVRLIVAGTPGKFPTTATSIATKLGVVSGCMFFAPTQGIAGMWTFEALLEADADAEIAEAKTEVGGTENTIESLTDESNPFADARISATFVADDADRMIDELENRPQSAMHWNRGEIVYKISRAISDTPKLLFEFHHLRPVGAALFDASHLANRYAAVHGLIADATTIEGSVITLTFKVGE